MPQARQIAPKADVMVRSFPRDRHARARQAAAAREIALGEYLARLIDLHDTLLEHAKRSDARGRAAARVLEATKLAEVRA